MFSSFILLFVVVILLCYRITRNSKTSPFKLMPKGPKTVPIFGNLLQVFSNPHKKFSEWAYKYGNVYTLNILGRPALVVNDFKTMKQIFGTFESTGKLNIIVLETLNGGRNGIFTLEGKEWQEIRILTMKALKECGMSRSSVIEPIILQISDETVDWFLTESENNRRSGIQFNLRNKFNECVSNLVWSIISRDGQNANNLDMGKYVVDLVNALQTTTKSGLLFLPWLKHIAPEWSGYNSLLQAVGGIHSTVEKQYKNRRQYRKTVKIEPEDRNLIDAYLDHWENCTDEKSCFYGEAGWKHCFYSLASILTAGGETTGTSLNWLVNYLVAYPNVQQKLYEEVTNTFGDEMPVLADRKRLPYLEAVIYETMRMTSEIPFGVIHRLLDNVKFEHYLLPKDTLLIANIYHAHNDKAVWGDPENFRPERFMESDKLQSGKLKDYVNVFQPGRRSCPGEGLAKDILLLMSARLVQQLEFLPVSGKTAQDYTEPEVGYMLLPKQVGVKVKARV